VGDGEGLVQGVPGGRRIVGLERIDAVQAQLGAAAGVDPHTVNAGSVT
jgi:hypothetical protein